MSAAQVYERGLITSQATSIDRLEAVSLSWKLMDNQLQDLTKFTSADVQKAARTYFARNHISVAHVLPKKKVHEWAYNVPARPY